MKKKGFTLIELLVVVLIIGILSAVALPQYRKAVEKSYAAEAMVNLKYMYQTKQLANMANGTEYTGKPSDIMELTGGQWTEDGSLYCTDKFGYDGIALLVGRCATYPNACDSTCMRMSDHDYLLGIREDGNIGCEGGTTGNTLLNNMCATLGLPPLYEP